MINIIGKAPINPILFYSGKIAGYITWILLILSLLGINVIDKISFGYNKYISLIFLIVGLLLTIISLFNLGRSTRFGLPFETTKLKTNGLYKICRNPMYLGLNSLTISAMIYSLNIWIILLGLYSLIVYHLIIRREEVFLENRFGLEYTNYKKMVRRYL